MRLRRDILIIVLFLYSASFADDLLYRYEGDVLPYDESAGWVLADPCGDKGQCSESIENGHLVLRWPQAQDLINYNLWIARPGETVPPNLWIEWSIRSNHPIGPNFYTCDAHFVVDYIEVLDLLNMYGDAVVSMSGGSFALGLEIEDFHTYRFESLDGVTFQFSVDGFVFYSATDFGDDDGYHALQFGGGGGCISDQIPNMVNEWDFVRYGTISTGEKIIASDPPNGFLNRNQFPSLDRFTITYDQPNYAYIDDITVEVTGGDAPNILQTHRLDNSGPEVLEIVLDKPIPLNEATRFIFNDGETTNIVNYSYILGDSDADGVHTLRDFAAFQNCFDQSTSTNNCSAFDFDGSSMIDIDDYNEFNLIHTNP